MKACSEKRKLIAWLALGELDDQDARKLQAHLESCSGCRDYFKEIKSVTAKLSAEELRSDTSAPEAFHRKVTARVRASEPVAAWETLLAALRSRRVAVPLVGAAAAIVALLVFHRRAEVSSPSSPRTPSATAALSEPALPPTVANYQMVANQSLDKLDALLTSQAKRTSAALPIYTASALALESSSD